MLILTRRVNQGIVIQGDITVTVLRVEYNRVKLGITAPAGVIVLREELLYRPRREPNLVPEENTSGTE